MKFPFDALRRPLTVALTLVSVAFGVLVIARVWHGTDAETLLSTPARKYAPPSTNLALPAAVTRPAIREHALLHATREFFVPPTPVTTPAAPPPPDYRLVGTFIIPRKPTIALLANSSGASRKVRPGDDLDGWLVQSVETRRVVLLYGNQSAEIVATGKSASAGMTAAPLSRRTIAPSSALPPAETPDAPPEPQGIPLPDRTASPVRTLGAGAAPGKPASGAVREASAAGNPLGTDARLYRPPPQ